jgi:hypothetical protein
MWRHDRCGRRNSASRPGFYDTVEEWDIATHVSPEETSWLNQSS